MSKTDTPKQKVCKDCEPRKKPLDAPYVGPRCYRHHHVWKKLQKDNNRDTYVERVYGISKREYRRLLEWQGGKCWICRVATGKAKALPVDHDHKCCPGPTSCGVCVRGICCSRCNELIGRLGPAALIRAALYLQHPPMRRFRAGQSAKPGPPD